MLSPDGRYIECNGPDCMNRLKNHRWAKTKAIDWFFMASADQAFCPDHIPDWVEAWRKSKEKK